MPLVAIVGRPNVGKSTLFNRLIEDKHAIVHNEPGVTRDRIYGEVEWNGVVFSLTDTGGYVSDSSDRFEAAIREQVEIATEEADLILLIVDVETGITDLDQSVAQMLRKTAKPVLLIANKADNQERRWDANVFYQLGLKDVFAVSATNGSGTGEVLDAIVEHLPAPPPDDEIDTRPHIALIGRPNVGKSSVSNALLNQNRSIVTEISGTTRDSINAVMKYHGDEIVLVDTAGLRKRARITENIEFYANLRTERAIQHCDVAVLLLDATQGLEAQDIRVLKQAESMSKGLVLAINKWDLLDKETNTERDFMHAIKERLKTLEYVPILTISAITKQRIYKLVDKAMEVHKQRSYRIPTSKLNEVMSAAIERNPPPKYRNRPVKIKYITQVRENPPVIAFFCNHPQAVKEPYQRYLANRLRESFNFEGVPIKLTFKSS
ncbi:MAG: ribosome biogenesis GTPase Der [Rhodothermales bacterium]